MIPETGKRYYIDYRDHQFPEFSYIGTGTFTGVIEEDSDEVDPSKGFLYRFDSLEVDFGFTDSGVFAEEDIIEEVKD
jgi:hypothetical protein